MTAEKEKQPLRTERQEPYGGAPRPGSPVGRLFRGGSLTMIRDGTQPVVWAGSFSGGGIRTEWGGALDEGRG